MNLADWLAWLAILTTVGSGDGLLRGGGGLSHSSSSSTGSSLMVSWGGTVVTLSVEEVEGCGPGPGTGAEAEDEAEAKGNGAVDSGIGRGFSEREG